MHTNDCSDDLNDKTFDLYTVKAYNTKSCLISEYREDIKRIKYIKRLLRRYRTKQILKEQLIINHLIIFYNVFESLSATRILFFRIDEADWPSLKTFLSFLGRLPRVVRSIKGNDVVTTGIPDDLNIRQKLEKL